MSLTHRITLKDLHEEPEDILAYAFGTIFPEDVAILHGDADHPLLYASPHLPLPFVIDLPNVSSEDERRLFSHHLWNSSLLLAEFIEADTLCLPLTPPRRNTDIVNFSVTGLKTLEVGAGTALPSIMGTLLGAREVVVTDYPSEALLTTLRTNVARNTRAECAPSPFSATVVVEGHAWGQVSDSVGIAHGGSCDRVIAADCLWMPWQHENLRTTLAHFLSDSEGARAWVCAGFHTGRENIRKFFDKEALKAKGLEVEAIWERDCDGAERDWESVTDDDVTKRKRWLIVGILKKIRASE